MSNLQILTKDTLFKATIPFAAKALLLSLEKLFAENSLHKEFFWMREINQLLSSHYGSFMLMMLFLSLVISRIKTLIDRDDSKRQITPTSVFKLMIYYSVIFCCFQLVSKVPNSSPLRQLDQIEESSSFSSEALILSPSLNPGEILGSITVDGTISSYNIVVSRDGKTVFSIQTDDSVLVVYDISNPKNVQVKAKVTLTVTFLFEPAMLLSRDQQVIYIVTHQEFLIVDVSNPTSPIQIFKEKGSSNAGGGFGMVESADEKILYVARMKDLAIYDVSQRKFTVLLFHQKRPSESYLTSGVILSEDNTILAFASEGKLEIFNVTNPSSPSLLCSTELTDFQIGSLAFSDDEMKILALGTGIEKRSFSFFSFDITNIKSPILLSSIKLYEDLGNESRFWFHSNKKYAFFYTSNEFRMVRIADSEQITLLYSNPDIGSSLKAFSASAENKINAAMFFGKIVLMKLDIDVVPKSLSYFKPNALQILDEKDYGRCYAIAFSKDEKNLFLVKTVMATGNLFSYERPNDTSIFKLSNATFKDKRSTPEMGYELPTNGDGSKWTIIAGKNVALVSYHQTPTQKGEIWIFNTTNQSSLSLLDNIDKKWSSPLAPWQVAALGLTEDEKTMIFINYTKSYKVSENSTTLNIMRIDNGQVTPVLERFKIPHLSQWASMKLSKARDEGSVIFYINQDLFIYNIQNIKSPLLESSFKLGFSQVITSALSKDEKIIYIFGVISDGVKKLLQILDISNIKTPLLLSSLRIEPPEISSQRTTDSLELSPDGKALYIGFSDGMFMIDVRRPTQPILLGFNYFKNEMHTPKLIHNGSLFQTASVSGITSFDISSQYILHLKNSKLKIGGSYSGALNVLKMNEDFKFDYMVKEHKFLKVSLFDNNSLLNYAALPNWITFDKERSILKIEPALVSVNKTYKISVTLSTQTQSSAFIELNSIQTLDKAEDLMLSLVHSGYIDTQGYISADFNLNQQLKIESKYKAIDKDIRAILSQNYIEALAEFSVGSSLSIISDTKPLQISTLSRDNIHVAIQLDQAYFLTKTYFNIRSTITNNRSLLILEGTLDNINEALRTVFIDLDDLTSCSGLVNITDGINPKLSQPIPNISDYFVKGKKSISITNEDHLEISSSLITTDLIVSIHLFAPPQTTNIPPYFISRSYPYLKSSITDNNTLLFLEGSLSDINHALQSIIVELNRFEFCDGMVNFTDGVNPLKSRFIPNISKYLVKNKETISFYQDKHLKISSLSPGRLTVTIQLDVNEYQAHFVQKPYLYIRVTITGEKNLMYLEGSQDDINEALKVILIDIEKPDAYFGGLVTVSDNINPPISLHIRNLTNYSIKNTAPFYHGTNFSLQDQIDKRPFSTGLYSTIDLNPSTFTDKNNLTLEYSLTMEDPKQELPSWISFRSLSLIGTPPEKYSPSFYKMVLIVKNEFKTTSIPFTLNIKISLSYGIKLAITYLGYLGSLVGFIFSINKIYNILAKKHYRYPRSFKLGIGQEITDQRIFPISFIQTERKESKKILQDLEKLLSQKIESFIAESQILDKRKIMYTLANLENEYYNGADEFSRGIIQQLVINHIVMKQLSSKQEAKTKEIFNKIKDKWMDLVIVNSSQFIINSENLNKQLSSSLDSTSTTTSGSFLLPTQKEDINRDLLENALLAHAFDFQNLNINKMFIEVISYKKIKGNSLWHMIKRLLLRDLRPFVFLNQREIGYGIEYTIKNKTLQFSGQLSLDLKDNVIVVHIKNHRGRILRELWITSGENQISNQDHSFMEHISEAL